MGDIADGILNGDFDEETGEYIGPGLGYPRSLARGKRDREKNYKHSSKLFGIINYLENQKLPKDSDWQMIIRDYNKAILLDETRNNEDIATEIQKNFGQFVKFIKTKYVLK